MEKTRSPGTQEPTPIPVRADRGEKKAIQVCIGILDDMKFESEFDFYTVEKAQEKLRKLLR